MVLHEISPFESLSCVDTCFLILLGAGQYRGFLSTVDNRTVNQEGFCRALSILKILDPPNCVRLRNSRVHPSFSREYLVLYLPILARRSF